MNVLDYAVSYAKAGFQVVTLDSSMRAVRRSSTRDLHKIHEDFNSLKKNVGILAGFVSQVTVLEVCGESPFLLYASLCETYNELADSDPLVVSKPGKMFFFWQYKNNFSGRKLFDFARFLNEKEVVVMPPSLSGDHIERTKLSELRISL